MNIAVHPYNKMEEKAIMLNKRSHEKRGQTL